MANNNNNDPVCCFREWMDLQEQDLSELLQATHSEAEHDHDDHNETEVDQLHQLIEKNVQHFQDYMQKRACLARQNVSTYFAPNWCTPLECSVLWIGGCRPTIFIRLLYGLIGEEIESKLEDYLEGRRTGKFGDTSATQMNLINSLHCKTIRDEDKLSVRLATLQEDIADFPISRQACRMVSGQPAASKEIEEALEKHARSMLTMMEEADGLRLNTLKAMINILTPVQAAKYLAAGKKLHLCIHKMSGSRGTTSGGQEQGRINP